MTKTIPFDYVFRFTLTGKRDNRVQDVVAISIEGVFVAVSMGYSLALDEQKPPRTFQPVTNQRTTPPNPVLVPFFPDPIIIGATAATIDGYLIAGMPDAEITVLDLTDGSLDPSLLDTGRVGPDGAVTLSRDIAAGTILRVWDRTNNLLGQVFQVGSPTTPVIGPNPTTRQLPVAGDTATFVYGSPRSRVGVFLLKGPDNSIRRVKRKVNTGEEDFFLLDEQTVFGRRTGAARVNLAQPLQAGDVLLVRTENVDVDPFSMFTIPRPRLSTLPLGALTAGLEKIGADLAGGFRLNPNFAALAGADLPFDQHASGTADRAFETGAVAAEEVSFLYSIDVVSTGRELQNKEIHNIAGLGIANGDRPFRPFAKPMMFEPRSSIRIQITEISDAPGTLFIVLQGYKMLGTGRIPG
jgi:hypothetical protein